ncbi:MAG: DNA internalization-related competence protein ComEC/Rec2 [Fidelibacterota bacterium]|nr:MAG: DNA internalization-related competence protein ComEC/Rec2 [Candidatus Neomarinimicrobiota bacterium]
MVLGHLSHLPWGLWVGIAVIGMIVSRSYDGALMVVVLALGGWLAPERSQLDELRELDSSRQYLFQGVVRDVRYREDRTDITLNLIAGLHDSLLIRRGLWRIYEGQELPSAGDKAVMPGDTLTLQSRLEWPDGRRNPNGFDYRYYLWARGVDVLIDDPVMVLDVEPGSSFHLGRVVALIRQQIADRMETWLGQPQKGLAMGLLLGDKSGLDDDFRNRINVLGIGHILAVSGLHVGYVVLVLMALVRLLPVPGNRRFIVVGIGLLGYVFLTGAPPSVVRASIMAFLYAWGRSLERQPGGWNLLGAAAIISLLIHPRSLFTASFQLSFAAVAGILYVYPQFRAWISSTIAGEWIYHRRPLRYTLDLFLVGLGAQLGTLPVILSVFHTASVYVLLANLMIIPLAGLAVIGELAAILTAVIWEGLGTIFANAAWLSLTVIQLSVDQLSRLPYTQLIIGHPGPVALVILVAGIIAIPYFFRPGRPRFRLRLAVIVLVMANLLVWRSALADRVLQVTVLDVGQGDAIHLALPDGRHVLVDAGMRNPWFDRGEQVVTPYLRGQGVSRLDVAVISHPQADHMGGFLYLLKHLRIAEIWDTPNRHSAMLYDRLKDLADSLEIPVRRLTTGEVVSLGAVDVFVLSPDSLLLADVLEVNNASLVLKVRYGSTSLLLMGDADRFVELRLLTYDDFLQTDWLKVGHHGSGTSSTLAFLEACRPTGAIVSVGESNIFHHPSEEVMARLTQIAQVVHRTDRDGALVLRSNGEQWHVTDWR